MRSANLRDTASICASSSRVDLQLSVGHPSDQLDRSVIVRRAEPTGDEADLGAILTLSQRLLELVRLVPDDDDARRLETEPQCFTHVERAVQVRPLAANELRPGDDRYGTRPRHQPTSEPTPTVS